MLPQRFQETILRLFVRDKEKLIVAQEAFRKFCDEKLGSSPSKLH